jgi:DNA-binding transcriptional LysR family regulator
MNLRHLSVFHGIAKAGSVNAAARLLHTSQPAVSRELRTLEERLGVLLFDRLPWGMRLTEADKVFIYARQTVRGSSHDFIPIEPTGLQDLCTERAPLRELF